MKRSYSWLVIFAIVAALSGCGPNKDNTYWGYAGASSEAEGESWNDNPTDVLVLDSVTLSTAIDADEEEIDDVAGAISKDAALSEVLATLNLGWEFTEEGIYTTGTVNTDNELVKRFLNQVAPDIDFDETGLPVGKLLTNYKGQLVSYEIDLSNFRIIKKMATGVAKDATPKDGMPPIIDEGSGRFRLNFSYDDNGNTKQVKISNYVPGIADWSQVGIYAFDNTYDGSRLKTQVVNFLDDDQDISQIYRASFKYGDDATKTVTYAKCYESTCAHKYSYYPDGFYENGKPRWSFESIHYHPTTWIDYARYDYTYNAIGQMVTRTAFNISSTVNDGSTQDVMSTTQIKDVNGNLVFDENGEPVYIEGRMYVIDVDYKAIPLFRTTNSYDAKGNVSKMEISMPREAAPAPAIADPKIVAPETVWNYVVYYELNFSYSAATGKLDTVVFDRPQYDKDSSKEPDVDWTLPATAKFNWVTKKVPGQAVPALNALNLPLGLNAVFDYYGAAYANKDGFWMLLDLAHDIFRFRHPS